MNASSLNQSRIFFQIAAIVSAIIVFVVDVTIPLGIAAGVPYVLSIVFAGQTQSKKYLIITALACSLLTLVGFWLSPTVEAVWKVVANRILAIGAIWTVVYVFFVVEKSIHGQNEDPHPTVISDVSPEFEHGSSFEIAPESLEQFLEYVRLSGVLNTRAVDSLFNKYRDKEAGEVAKILVRENVLTKYQVSMIFHGQWKTLVFGENVVVDQIGRGGIGVVLRARNKRTGKEVAIKILQSRAKGAKAIQSRFVREIDATLAMDHPNIIKAFSSGMNDDIAYLVVEFVNGDDLQKKVANEGPLSFDLALDYIVQAGRGIAHAHQHGVVHRDVKPSNLLVDKHGIVKVLDLGLAQYTIGETMAESDVTQTGVFCGTLDFMAPEQVLDFKNADPRVDIFALGQTFRFLLSGKSFLEGSTHQDKIKALATGSKDLFSPLKSQDKIPMGVQVIFKKMIEPSVGKRFQSMDQVVEELESFLF